jgi:hypothetical protein
VGQSQSCHPTCQRLYPSFAVLSILLSPSDCVSRNGRQVAGPFFKLASPPLFLQIFVPCPLSSLTWTALHMLCRTAVCFLVITTVHHNTPAQTWLL